MVSLPVIWICLSAVSSETLSLSLWDFPPPYCISSIGEKGASQLVNAPWKQKCSHVKTFLFFFIQMQPFEKENTYSNTVIPGEEFSCCPRHSILSYVLLLVTSTSPVKPADTSVCSRLKLLQCSAFLLIRASLNRLTFKEVCEQWHLVALPAKHYLPPLCNCWFSYPAELVAKLSCQLASHQTLNEPGWNAGGHRHPTDHLWKSVEGKPQIAHAVNSRLLDHLSIVRQQTMRHQPYYTDFC